MLLILRTSSLASPGCRRWVAEASIPSVGMQAIPIGNILGASYASALDGSFFGTRIEFSPGAFNPAADWLAMSRW
jgi:hypothetical protein